MGLFSALLGNAGTIDPVKLEKEFSNLLTENENIEMGFRLIRDTFIFTNKRMIMINVQGITGSKQEYLSVPYKSISRFCIESAGTFDLEAELKIWISSEQQPSIRKNFR